MSTYDIGTFVGTIEQRDKILREGKTIGQFIESGIDIHGEHYQIVHVSEPLPEGQDSSLLIQRAFDAAYKLSRGEVITGNSDSLGVSIEFPKGDYHLSSCVVDKRQLAIEKPKIQDKQCYYRNFICK
jgi:hypothetical protein